MNLDRFCRIIALLFLFAYQAIGQFECVSNLDKEFFSYSTSDIISNSCEGNKGNCMGRIQWIDGSSYEGAIKNSQMHGVGKITYANKFQYDGEWKFGKKEGFGLLTFPCGSEYLGRFENDKMHGEGVIWIGEKESFTGSWENGKIIGEGIHYRPDGSIFTGQFEDGEKNGKGMIVWASRDTMWGSWKNGLQENTSRFQFADGSVIIQTWKNGKVKHDALYVQEDGFYLSGIPENVISNLMNSPLTTSQSVENNFSLAWYIAAMEYKSQKDFDGATQQLLYAQSFQNPLEESALANILSQELEVVSQEKDRVGVAKKE